MNGKPVQMSVSPQIVDGRTMVPVRFVSEALGDQVEWDGATRTVKVTRKPSGPDVTTALITPDDLPFAGFSVLEGPFGSGWMRYYVQGTEEAAGGPLVSVGMAPLKGDPAQAVSSTPCQPNEKLYLRPTLGDAARACHLTRNGLPEVTLTVAWRDRVIVVTVHEMENDFAFAYGLALALARQQLEILERLAGGQSRPAPAALDPALVEGLANRGPQGKAGGEAGGGTGIGATPEPAVAEEMAAAEWARLEVLEFPTTPERFDLGALRAPDAATAGEPYSFSFCDQAVDEATDLCGWPRAGTPRGGRSPYRFYTNSGFPSIGLSLLPNGLLAGTPPAAAGGREYGFVVCAADLAGVEICQDTVLTVAPSRVPVEPLQFYLADRLPWGRVGQPYRHSICEPEPVGAAGCGGGEASVIPTGGVPPYSFRLDGGTLPAGMALSANGVLSGTPGPGTLRNDLTICAADGAGTEVCRKETLWINQNSEALMLQNTAWKGTFTVQDRFTKAPLAGSLSFRIGSIPSAETTNLTVSDVTLTFHETHRLQRAYVYCPYERAECTGFDITFYGPNGQTANLSFQFNASVDGLSSGMVSPTAIEGTAFYSGRIAGRFTAARQ